MKKFLMAVPILLALSNFAAAEIVTGTYDIDTVYGSSTTLGGSSADAYNLTSTGFSTFSLLTFTPDPSAVFSFAEMDNLSLDYNAVVGGIAGGGPRLEVDFTNGDYLLAYLGPAGSFADPTLGAGTSGNLLAMNDTGRYDVTGVGGAFYTNYAAALAAAGGLDVADITVIVDGGWATTGNTQEFDLDSNPLSVDATPEPGTLGLIGLGLTTLAFIGRKRRKA